MKAGRIIMLVAGAFLALIGFAVLAGAGIGIAAYASQRTDAAAERVELDPEALAGVRAELAPVEAALWDEADACACGSDADRLVFTHRAFSSR